MNKYFIIGSIENGIIHAGSTENGMVYKNEDAYYNRPDEICYVPEYGFPEDSSEYCGKIEEVSGYSRNDLMELCNGNRQLCDAVFQCVDWQDPSTWLSEIDEGEFAND